MIGGVGVAGGGREELGDGELDGVRVSSQLAESKVNGFQATGGCDFDFEELLLDPAGHLHARDSETHG
jgi:hypothetical protein